ncbi:unnamed protein product [Ambrosiozyma monospora]|uniref:Unnamed protein product n=1 Tax=Ambrosiozyma monospora TaxID=43982 RepID=A0ACB5T7E5_AMBMO|nr:unnamed protein product [Ambrosiozyma monospora]
MIKLTSCRSGYNMFQQQQQQQQQIPSSSYQTTDTDHDEPDSIQEFIPELYQLGVEPSHLDNIHDSELVPLLSDLANLVVENKTSEPRDFLMTERTTLAWVKFSTTLLVSSIAIHLSWRLDTSTMSENDGDDLPSGNDGDEMGDKLKFGTSLFFVFMSIGCVMLGAYNYFHSIYSFQRERIDTYDVKATFSVLLVIIIILMIVNVIFMVYD